MVGLTGARASSAATPGGSWLASRALCLRGRAPFPEPVERGVEASRLQEQLEDREAVGCLGEQEGGVRRFQQGTLFLPEEA